jgi:hypothetical protein
MNRLITIGSMLFLGAAAAACNRADPPATVQRDVAKAEAARTANVAEARKEGAQEVQLEELEVTAHRLDVRDARASRNYEVALAKAEGDYQVAAASCEALSGSGQVSCKDQAEAVLKSDTARAELLKPKS